MTMTPVSWILAELPSAPPDNPPGFVLWMIEQATGETTFTTLAIWVCTWIFFVLFVVASLRRLNEGAQTFAEVVSRTFSQPVNLLKDIFAGLAGAALLLLGVLWGLATFWVATKWGSYVADSPGSAGPMGGMFPVNVVSVAYLILAGANVLISLWIGFGGIDRADAVVESDFLSKIWLFPVLVMLPTALVGLADVIFGPPPQYFWEWVGILLFHFGGWFALPLVWAGMKSLIKMRTGGRKLDRHRRHVETVVERRIAEMRRTWGERPDSQDSGAAWRSRDRPYGN
jgi:hypothetical protein